MDNGSNVTDIRETLVSIEKKHDIYHQQISNIYFYERFRSMVFKNIQSKLGVRQTKTESNGRYRTKTSPNKLSDKLSVYMAAIKGILRSSISKNPYTASDYDVLAFGTSKRFKNSNRKWEDKILDPILKLSTKRAAVLERTDHQRPVVSENILYIDIPWYLGHVPAELNTLNFSLEQNDISRLTKFEQDIEAEFGVSIDLVGRVRRHLARRRVRLPLFKKMLSRISPNVVLMRGAHGEMKSTFIEACNTKKIPVLDLQFRLIDQNDLNYHYPKGVTKHIRPDYLLVWGDFWHDNISPAIPKNDIHPIGYPYLNNQVDYHREHEKTNSVMVLSGTGRELLADFTTELATEIGTDTDWKVWWKPHPGEREDYSERSIYQGVVNHSNIKIIDDPDVSLFELFSKCKVVVGVTTTALYESLPFSTKAYVLESQFKNEMNPLVNNTEAEFIGSAVDLVSKLEKGNVNQRPDSNLDYVFKQLDDDEIRKVLNKLIGPDLF